MKTIFFILALLSTSLLSAQTLSSASLEININDVIGNLPLASADDYQDPTLEQAADWRSLIQMIIDEEYDAAAVAAGLLEYEFYRYIDNSTSVDRVFYLLVKAPAGNNYWGTYVFKPNACRRLVIQCPHPIADLNTGRQGIYLYMRLDAYAYFLNGTHRCNAIEASDCSGTTSVCGSSAAYRRSDVAHNHQSGFQLTSEVLFDAFPDLYFAQLHGFSKKDTDPYLILSNGSRDVPAVDYLASVRDGLSQADTSLTFKIGHLDTNWNRLLGFTNTQGRYLNSSADACNQNATMGSGHFMHIEQEYSKLRSDEMAWDKMLLAMEEAFSCLSVAQDDLVSETIYWQMQSGRIQFQLPASGRYQVTFYNWLGQVMAAQMIDPNESVDLENRTGVFVVEGANGFRKAGRFF